MKLDIIKTIIAVALGALMGWGLSAMAHDEVDALPLGIITGVEVGLLCIGLFGINYAVHPRSGVMIRAALFVGLVVLLVIDGIYAALGISTSYYVLSGVLALVVLLIANAVYKSKQ